MLWTEYNNNRPHAPQVMQPTGMCYRYVPRQVVLADADVSTKECAVLRRGTHDDLSRDGESIRLANFACNGVV